MARYDESDDDRVVVIERERGTNGIGTFLLGLAPDDMASSAGEESAGAPGEG